jgi:MFS family permease
MTPRRAWAGLVLAASMAFVVGFAITAVNLSLKAIRDDFDGAPLSTLSWGVTGYSIVSAALMLGPASLSLVLSLFPDHRRPTTAAAWTALSNLGSAVGPSLSAVVTDNFSWRWVFILPLVLCVNALVLSDRLLPSGGPDTPVLRPLDVVGAAIGTAVVGLVAHVITSGPNEGWSASSVMWPIGIASLLGIWFVQRTRQHPEPLIHPRLFTRRRFRTSATACVFLSAAGLSQWLVHPLFLQDRSGYALRDVG